MTLLSLLSKPEVSERPIIDGGTKQQGCAKVSQFAGFRLRDNRIAPAAGFSVLVVARAPNRYSTATATAGLQL